LHIIETVDSIPFAEKLNKAVTAKYAKANNKSLLKIMIQVNTSNETRK
jgi:uncharacterized pyridoxal phosphate-containing UPF0001 family protein